MEAGFEGVFSALNRIQSADSAKDLHCGTAIFLFKGFAVGSWRPLLLYDNDCGICSRFALLARKTSRGWVDPIGLFTKRGAQIKSDFFRRDDRPDEMFWILLGDIAYGGRSGLLPLVREIIRGRVI